MNPARILTAFLAFSLILLISSGQAQVKSDESREQNKETLRVDVDLVLINATVTDSDNRYVTGLGSENFQIWEDKVEQQIEYFSSEDVPLSAGLVFDVSGSMAGMLPMARSAAVTFLRMGNPQDEYFLVEFSDDPRLVRDFTSDIADLQHRIAFSNAGGRTALYDAMYLAMDKVSRGSNPRKALVLITDGQDNRSRYSYSNVKEFAKERDIQVYAIALSAPTTTQYVSRMAGTAVLNDLTKVTGGRAFAPYSVNEMDGICRRIGLELKSQYILGYRSTNTVKDGKWRKIKAKVVPSQGMPRMSVRAKSGYYASMLERASK
jgi:Ca-activated chloride channel family protein